MVALGLLFIHKYMYGYMYGMSVYV